MHRLVQAVARSRAERIGCGAERFRAPDRAPRGDPPRTMAIGNPASWPRCAPFDAACRRELQKGDSRRRYERAMGLPSEQCRRVIFLAVPSFRRPNCFSNARWLFARRRSAPAIPIRLRASTTLPSLLKSQGNLPGARPLYERALTIDEKYVRPRSPRGLRRVSTTSRSCFGLRATPRGRGRCVERALAIRERALGPNISDTATSLNNLGTPASGPARPRGSATALGASAGDP